MKLRNNAARPEITAGYSIQSSGVYKEYFRLSDLPFSIAPDPAFLYMSTKHREALAHLVYGVSSDSAFILLTGEVGTGKTTVCRCMLDQLPDNCDTAFILNPKLTEEELLASICEEIRHRIPGRRSQRKEPRRPYQQSSSEIPRSRTQDIADHRRGADPQPFCA